MIIRIILFLLGYALSLIGLIYIIGYLNILSLGYNLLFYIHFIIRRIECLYFPIGFLLITISIFFKGGDTNELHIWYYFKFS